MFKFPTYSYMTMNQTQYIAGCNAVMKMKYFTLALGVLDVIHPPFSQFIFPLPIAHDDI